MTTDELAYYLWEQAGSPHGQDREFWFLAERMQKERVERQRQEEAERIAERESERLRLEKRRKQRDEEDDRNRRRAQEEADNSAGLTMSILASILG